MFVKIDLEGILMASRTQRRKHRGKKARGLPAQTGLALRTGDLLSDRVRSAA